VDQEETVSPLVAGHKPVLANDNQLKCDSDLSEAMGVSRDQGQEDRHVSLGSIAPAGKDRIILDTLTCSDATLLTNRFHFAMREGELRGKGALIGWYK
jgi:hypothetical protein